MKYFVLYFILLFGFTSLSFAQDNPVKFLDISDGLSNNSVTTIFQDDDGYMWFGTYDGLNRYDGYNFKVFRNRINDKKSLSFNTIYNIEGDSKKNIWVGGANGISIYNKATASFHFVEYIASNKKQKTLQDIIHQMRAVSDHLVLVASQSLGLIRFENGSFIGKQIPLTALGNRIMINNYDAIAIQEDQKNNHAWVYVRNVGICSYNYSNKSLKAVFPLSKEVKAMKLASDGNLWLGTDEGLFLFNTKTGNISDNYFPNKCSVTDLLVDKKKEIWITTDGCGIYKVIGTNNKAIPYNSVNENQLAKSNSVWSLYEDKGGNKWFGSLRGGISMLSSTPKYFKSIRYNAKNPAENFILSFCEDEKKNVWVGTDGAGLKYWDRKTNTYSNYGNKLSSPFITGITRDNNNEIWLSTWAGGVNKINPKNNSVTQYSCYNPYTKQIEKNIWFVYKDSKNNIWAGATNEGALYLLDRAKNSFVLFDKAVTNLQCMIETSDGKLWAGNYTSLFSLEKTTRKINKIPIGNQIRYIHEDRDKNLWIGTQEGGLLLFDRKSNTFKRYTTDDGLPSNTILRLLEDKEGNLWMSTYNGICRFDKKQQTFRNFSVNDGLQSNQFSFNAGIELSTGEFLFGGINGFNIFFPEAIKGYNQKNNLLLSDFSVNNQSIEESKVEVSDSGKMKEVRLDYDQTALSLEFVAIDYNNADKINYAYFLEGWDEQWNYVGQARKANYSRLPEGKYIFKVKTTNFKGGWNKEVSLVSIQVLPPWYRTWWAYTLYLFAVAGALFVYLDYQKNKEKLKYKVKIAELESKKEKEIAEKQSSMFTYISHEFRTPLSLIINPLKKAVQKERVENGSSGSDLAIAHRNARRLLSLVDQLLLFRKAENDADSLRLSPIDVNKLCNEVYQCFVNQAKDKNISYNFQIPENEIEIIGDYEKIEISLFNLMSNAFKYTPVGGEITLRLTETSTDVAMEISDSGEGIDKADIEVIFEKFKQINSKVSIGTGFGIGLFIVKYFVDKHKGKVSCSSEIGKGSIFKLTFLKGNSHFDNVVITNDVQKRTQLFDELIVDDFDENTSKANNQVSESDFQKVMLTEKRTVLIIDDNDDIRNYLIKMFSENYMVYSAENGAEGLKMTKKHMPDLVISDITMEQMDGLELCRKIKESNDLSHIPVILLTASKNPETHLQGINDGADDYITKPFDDDILVARVESLLRNRSNLRTYFLDSITLKENAQKVPVEYQEILKKCIDIVERNIHKKDFTIKTFAQEMGMSHRTLYTKIKIISGQTLNAFIRSLRIRRAAMLMLTEDMNIAQASAEVGFEDPKYFRQQFVKLFGMTPSDYIKKYKSSFNSDLNIIN
ncbi:hybrid sensor histidine kinase/response regulator transcription factor [Flavobacterium denitrificans]|uniref:hybrid sensor histidine kinase/response regulator transcription factor n=1 Tax=Flavobacterium denitrificans TaxID=281361 RepID=UPI00047AA7AE|nr:hybrid sensor histidine kinase/response regulator transcription factor [Flavobacterium denitrificans]